ncbi:protein of unknown function [Chitinophaga costaii]|uniref:DUF4302 domain-containing protein n=1 Tax=Chitinophaga costaii TaxID=1335309 RepID=A0A1C3YXD9_9BACT|nr:DUF4302 domain-containing protein [Chitinophaga costaii]PUZ30138.1 DUF4302 domain-containing protein [Chitinophaga costaii]SCB74688.1 protein of unknown function [Chitinophaga costaii]
MKRYLVFIALILALLASCRKEGVDPASGQRPEERTEAKLHAYQSALTGSNNGWIAYLYPQGGGGFSFFLKFTDSNRVSMMADISETSTLEPFESSYRLKSVLAPSLLFDTYNYLHLLADPSPGVLGGVAGWGLYSDFEFSFDSLFNDSITLRGNLLDSKMILVKATAAQEASYEAGGLNTLVHELLDYTASNLNLYVLLGDDTKIQTTINPNTKVITLNWLKDNVISSSASAFAFTLTGIVLQQPVEYNGKKIYELTWDNDNQVLYAMVDGQKVVVQASPTPILPLHLLIGVSYTDIIVPNATDYPGWSEDFKTRRATAAASMQAGPYGLRMDRMQFLFSVPANQMLLELDIYQGSNKFLADFLYNYTKTDEGVYKFSGVTPTGNAGLIVNDMAPLTTQRLNADHFILDYYIDQASGSILGQFKSVEHEDFTFTGTLN